MIWGWRPHVDTPIYIIKQAQYVLGFNEPNFSQQSNISPQDAATHWKTIENKATGKVLVSPAIAPCIHCNMSPFQWLDEFSNIVMVVESIILPHMRIGVTLIKLCTT